MLNGTFTIEDGKLKAGPGDYNLITYQSFNAYGTWSFDLLSNSQAEIIFIGTYPINMVATPRPQQGFFISLGESSLTLLRYVNGTQKFISWGHTAKDFSWQHIDLTRNLDGRICIYINSTLVGDIVDKSIPESEFFSLWSGRGAIIDNIVVSSTVDIQPPAAPFYMQPWFIPSIAAIALIAVATVVLLMRRK